MRRNDFEEDALLAVSRAQREAMVLPARLRRMLVLIEAGHTYEAALLATEPTEPAQ